MPHDDRLQGQYEEDVDRWQRHPVAGGQIGPRGLRHQPTRGGLPQGLLTPGEELLRALLGSPGQGQGWRAPSALEPFIQSPDDPRTPTPENVEADQRFWSEEGRVDPFESGLSREEILAKRRELQRLLDQNRRRGRADPFFNPWDTNEPVDVPIYPPPPIG